MTIKIPYFIAGDPDLDTTYRLLLHASKFAPAIALALPFPILWQEVRLHKKPMLGL